MRDRRVRERLGTIMFHSKETLSVDDTSAKPFDEKGEWHRPGRVSRARSDKITVSMPHSPPQLSLAYGLRFADLYAREGLVAVDQRFIEHLRERDAAAAGRFLAARAAPEALAYKDEADLLIAIAPELDRFIAKLFDIEAAW